MLQYDSISVKQYTVKGIIIVALLSTSFQLLRCSTANGVTHIAYTYTKNDSYTHKRTHIHTVQRRAYRICDCAFATQ